MSFDIPPWLAGAGAGFAVGGPIGAAVGAGAGLLFSSPRAAAAGAQPRGQPQIATNDTAAVIVDGKGPQPAPADLFSQPGLAIGPGGNLVLLSVVQQKQATDQAQALMSALFGKSPGKVTTVPRQSALTAALIKPDDVWTTGESGKGNMVNNAGFIFQLPSGVAVRRHADGTAEYLGWAAGGQYALKYGQGGALIAAWAPVNSFPGAMLLKDANKDTGLEKAGVQLAQTAIKAGAQAAMAGFGDLTDDKTYENLIGAGWSTVRETGPNGERKLLNPDSGEVRLFPRVTPPAALGALKWIKYGAFGLGGFLLLSRVLGRRRGGVLGGFKSTKWRKRSARRRAKTH